MSCNLNRPDTDWPLPPLVSIPIGFSNELQLPLRAHPRRGRDLVSIPIGFSNELQHPPEPPRSRPVGDVFQSLSGFPMSCNVSGDAGTRLGRNVSIPIGFSNELQPTCIPTRMPPEGGFNPYRVFQ